MVPPNMRYFCTVYYYGGGKRILSRAIGIQKENWG